MTNDEFKKKYSQESYLGDGLYVSFDGYNIILKAPREDGDYYISLEPSVLKALSLYFNKIFKDIEKIK